MGACSSHTMIMSEPQGAKVYIEGQYRGKTPLYYSDAKITGAETRIRLEKEGYETLETYLYRDEKVDAGAIIGGVFFIVPFLWIMEYDDVHTYQLQWNGESEEAEEDTTARVKRKKPDENYKARYERLRELKKLLDEGVISKEEYEKEKKKILDEDQ